MNGFDLTLSPSKSVSLIWALGSPDDARHVEEALYAARDEVERYLEQTACFVRRGHAGAVQEPGKGFFGAVFLHRTSRLGDPGIHLHWTVFNVTEGPDGRRTALDGTGALQGALHRRGDLPGDAPPRARRASRRRVRRGRPTRRRRDHRDQPADAQGLLAPPSRDRRRDGTTRRPLRRRGSHRHAQHSQAEAHRHHRGGAPNASGASVPSTTASISTASPASREPRHSGSTTLSCRSLSSRRTPRSNDATPSVLQRRAASQGATLDEITTRADQYLAGDEVASVAEGRWTTKRILAAERQVIGAASREPDALLRADPLAIDAAIEARPSLSGEQRRMVESLCGSGRSVDVVIGRAGAGKTFTLDAVREAFEASGHQVIGISLAARAARELESGAGIHSSTAHALHGQLENGRRRFRPGDVLVVDEAGMLGTILMADLVERATTNGGKVILVGDPKQLPPIEAGGLFASLANRIPIVELVENRRQRDPEERFIANALRKGLTELAVRRLDRHGRVTIAHNSDVLRDQMTLDWFELHTTGRDAVMGAVHNSDVADLNERAHALLEASGELGPLVAVVDERRYCVGDRVLGLDNRYDLGILNGDLGRIVGADGDLHHRATRRRSLRPPPARLRDR